MAQKGPVPEALLDRLSRKFTVGDGCWEWTAYRDAQGYGKVRVGRQTFGAHRVVYELMVGPVPDGLQLDHLCRNRGCVRPAHLEPVTQRENILRGEGIAAQEARSTACPRGHPYAVRRRGSKQSRYCPICNAVSSRAPHAR